MARGRFGDSVDKSRIRIDCFQRSDGFKESALSYSVELIKSGFQLSKFLSVQLLARLIIRIFISTSLLFVKLFGTLKTQ